MKRISIEKLKLENKSMLQRVEEIDNEMKKLIGEKLVLQEKINKNVSRLSMIEMARGNKNEA